jgi:hypothetical protein
MSDKFESFCAFVYITHKSDEADSNHHLKTELQFDLSVLGLLQAADDFFYHIGTQKHKNIYYNSQRYLNLSSNERFC